MIAAMADLEDHAIQRDKRFLVRLVLALLVGAVAGAFIYSEMTSADIGNCAAEAFQGVTADDAPPGEGAGQDAPPQD